MSEIVKEVRAFLHWYKEVYGSDVLLEGELADGSAEPVAKPMVKPVPRPVSTPGKGFDERLIHQNNREIKEFYHAIRECQKCPLGQSRKNFVFGMGNPEAEIMFVGEAPGRDEDLQGLPFVGKAGQLLDKMLFAMQLQRDEVYIANVLKCRPPQNRDPQPDEVNECEPYLKKQIEMIKPSVIVALGRISAQVLLKTDEPLSRLRHRSHSYASIPFVVTYHPAALLRNPRFKADAWSDLKKIREYI